MPAVEEVIKVIFISNLDFGRGSKVGFPCIPLLEAESISDLPLSDARC